MKSALGLLALAVVTGLSAAVLTHLRRQGAATQLIVDDQPFLVRGGELSNSHGEPDYLRPFWPKLKALNLNAVVVPVYWDVIEPDEGKFDFASVDCLFTDARASANDWAAETRRLFKADADLMDHFNRTSAGGKWAHFTDRPHLGYTTWRDPPKNSLEAIQLTELAAPIAAAMGIAVEGSVAAWPAAVAEAGLPTFDAFNRQRHFVEVFKKGETPFAFTAVARASWIVASETGGRVEKDRRLWVDIDWTRAPHGVANGTVCFEGAGGEVFVKVETFNPTEITRETLRGFVESGGVVSIEAEHFATNTAAGANHWITVEDYGRTLSGMRAESPVDAPAATPGRDSAGLAYDIYVFDAGKVDVTAIVAPTLNFIAGRDLRCAISFDDGPAKVVTLAPRDFQANNRKADWEKVVGDNARTAHLSQTLDQAGYHTLKFWMIDPGVVLQKLVVDFGGLRPSYLGPPESFRFVKSPSAATLKIPP